MISNYNRVAYELQEVTDNIETTTYITGAKEKYTILNYKKILAIVQPILLRRKDLYYYYRLKANGQKIEFEDQFINSSMIKISPFFTV